MKIECVKEKLSRALQKIEKVAVKNPTLPVLKGILLQTSENTLTLKATDLDVGVEIDIPSRVTEEGSSVVPADVITHLITNIPDEGSIFIEKGEEGETLTISSERTSTEITTYPANDFPTIPKASGDEGVFSLSGSDIETGIRSVWNSASTSNIKPELASVYMYEKEGDVFFVATDVFRLSEKRITVSDQIQDISLLLPYKNTHHIIRLLNTTKKVTINVDDGHISFMADDVHITSRTINGTFPDYKQIIPSEFTTQCTLLKEDLINALKINSFFSGEFNRVKFIVQPSNEEFIIETSNTHVGKNRTELEVKSEGEEIEMTFNHKYLTDCLSSFSDESIVIGFSGSGKPLTIRGVNDNSFLHLIMPMNK